MPAIPLVAAVAVSAGAKAISANQDRVAANKISDAQLKAADAGQIDIQALSKQTQDMSVENAQLSKQLEQQLTPEVSALKTQSVQGVVDQLNNTDPNIAKAQAMIGNQLGQSAGSVDPTLLNAAIQKAQEQLALGGKIDPETQNVITRAAMGKAAGVGGGDVGLGRDITARDLGLTSLQLFNDRLSSATTLGKAQEEIQMNQASLKAGDMTRLLAQAGALNGLDLSQFQKSLSAAQFGQSIAAPQVGLSPGTAADIAVRNSNLKAGLGLQAATTQAQGNAAGTKGAVSAIGGAASSLIGGMGGSLFNQQDPTYGATSINQGTGQAGWTQAQIDAANNAGTGWKF